MKSLVVEPEDIFREVANMLDFLLYHEQKITQRAVNNLWTILVNDVRSWKSDAKDEDKMLVADTVFCIVRDTLGHHYKSRFYDEIYGMLTTTLESNLKVRDEDEQRQILNLLTECSHLLNDWINSYDDEEVWLSDEIEACLRKRKPEGKEPTVVAEKADYSRYSFTLKCPPKYKGKEIKFLEWLHDELKEKHFIEDFGYLVLGEDLEHIVDIDEKNKIVFNAVFSGADTDYHIVWIRDKVELRYFINQLVERNAITWKKGPRKWQIVRNRIWYRIEEKETSDATGKKYPKYTYVQFGQHDLDKGNKPADTTELDKILDIVAPPTTSVQKRDVGREIREEFNKCADYELTVPSSRGSKLGAGYRDLSHKANNGD